MLNKGVMNCGECEQLEDDEMELEYEVSVGEVCISVVTLHFKSDS